jgi:hypothetical protein
MRKVLVLLAVLGLLFGTAGTAAAQYEPVNIVHTEKVQAGPYGLTVGFSTWPLRARQSLDFTFVPDGGIEGKSGRLQMISPTGRPGRLQGLARHPRKLDVWGLDIKSLDTEGNWSIHFALDGPEGRAEGDLSGLAVLEQPGPPMALNWSIAVLPLFALIAFLTIAWRRTSRVT